MAYRDKINSYTRLIQLDNLPSTIDTIWFIENMEDSAVLRDVFVAYVKSMRRQMDGIESRVDKLEESLSEITGRK